MPARTIRRFRIGVDLVRIRLLRVVCSLGAIALAASAAPAGQLAITKISFHQYDGGPPVASDFEYFPGDLVFLTFRIAGFQTSKRDDEDHYQLTYTVSALDPEGVPLSEPKDGALAGELTRQDKKKHWMPLVRYDSPIPPGAPSGECTLRVKVTDKVSQAVAESKLTFQVRGRDVEPSQTLVLRNFHFYRTETSTRPMRRAFYRPGASVWARFDITGYKFGENNSLSVDYGIRVLRASGKTLFEQPVAAKEKHQSFYPERHIQGGLSLNLTNDLTPGEYTLIVSVHDRIGDQSYEERHVVTVE